MLVTYYKTERRNYYNGETEFYVIPKEENAFSKNGMLRCIGNIPVYDNGTPLIIQGEYINDVFKVTTCELSPQTRKHAELILRHISDKLTDMQLDKILEISQCNLFEFVLRFDAKDQLLRIFGKTRDPEKFAGMIYDGIKKLHDNELYTVMFLKYHMPLDAIEGLSKKTISYEEFKQKPYIYGLQVHIPIEFIDMFAFEECGIDEYNGARLCGYVYECLLKSLDQGDTCLTFEVLLKRVNYLLKNKSYKEITIGAGLLNMCIYSMHKYICIDIINETPFIYLNHVKKEEDLIIMGLERLMRNKKKIPVKKTVEEVEKEVGIKYNEGQKAAFELIKTSGIKILTGPPGSGKTAVIDGLIRSVSLDKIELSATTGMAAKVMSNACKRNAQTVHKLIEYIPYGDTEKCKDINDPIDAELIIIDEVSMLGVKLCSLLLNAIKNESIVLFVGDEDQLESVEYGNILHDLIKSGVIEVYRLTEIMRQSGTICQNANNIKQGNECLINDESFIVHECASDEDATKLLMKEYKKESSQIITPTKKGVLGTMAIHELFENKNELSTISYGRKNFRVGDKIVMTANNYNHGYINGDIGYVESIRDGIMLIDFGTKKIELSQSDLYNVDFADAVTIHKSQGSEYENVYIVLPKYAEYMITKRMLYTAVTRCKSKVIIYSVQNTINTAIKNVHEHKRCTQLLGKIKTV